MDTIPAKDTKRSLPTTSRDQNRTIACTFANTDYRRPVEGRLVVDGPTITRGGVYEIAPSDQRTYVNQDQPDVFQPHESTLPGPSTVWRFPAGSVSAIEIDTAGT
jgi:hypothetical protein